MDTALVARFLESHKRTPKVLPRRVVSLTIANLQLAPSSHLSTDIATIHQLLLQCHQCHRHSLALLMALNSVRFMELQVLVRCSLMVTANFTLHHLQQQPTLRDMALHFLPSGIHSLVVQRIQHKHHRQLHLGAQAINKLTIRSATLTTTLLVESLLHQVMEFMHLLNTPHQLLLRIHQNTRLRPWLATRVQLKSQMTVHPHQLLLVMLQLAILAELGDRFVECILYKLPVQLFVIYTSSGCFVESVSVIPWL